MPQAESKGKPVAMLGTRGDRPVPEWVLAELGKPATRMVKRLRDPIRGQGLSAPEAAQVLGYTPHTMYWLMLREWGCRGLGGERLDTWDEYLLEPSGKLRRVLVCSPIQVAQIQTARTSLEDWLRSIHCDADSRAFFRQLTPDLGLASAASVACLEHVSSLFAITNDARFLYRDLAQKLPPDVRAAFPEEVARFEENGGTLNPDAAEDYIAEVTELQLRYGHYAAAIRAVTVDLTAARQRIGSRSWHKEGQVSPVPYHVHEWLLCEARYVLGGFCAEADDEEFPPVDPLEIRKQFHFLCLHFDDSRESWERDISRWLPWLREEATWAMLVRRESEPRVVVLSNQSVDENPTGRSPRGVQTSTHTDAGAVPTGDPPNAASPAGGAAVNPLPSAGYQPDGSRAPNPTRIGDRAEPPFWLHWDNMKHQIGTRMFNLSWKLLNFFWSRDSATFAELQGERNPWTNPVTDSTINTAVNRFNNEIWRMAFLGSFMSLRGKWRRCSGRLSQNTICNPTC